MGGDACIALKNINKVELASKSCAEDAVQIALIKGLEKYKKVIERKSKKLNPYPHQDFACDNCQSECQQETLYSLAPNLSQLKRYHTYCSDCAVR